MPTVKFAQADVEHIVNARQPLPTPAATDTTAQNRKHCGSSMWRCWLPPASRASANHHKAPAKRSGEAHHCCMRPPRPCRYVPSISPPNETPLCSNRLGNHKAITGVLYLRHKSAYSIKFDRNRTTPWDILNRAGLIGRRARYEIAVRTTLLLWVSRPCMPKSIFTSGGETGSAVTRIYLAYLRDSSSRILLRFIRRKLNKFIHETPAMFLTTRQQPQSTPVI